MNPHLNLHFLVAALFVSMLLAPCLVTLFGRREENEGSLAKDATLDRNSQKQTPPQADAPRERSLARARVAVVRAKANTAAQQPAPAVPAKVRELRMERVVPSRPVTMAGDSATLVGDLESAARLAEAEAIVANAAASRAATAALVAAARAAAAKAQVAVELAATAEQAAIAAIQSDPYTRVRAAQPLIASSYPEYRQNQVELNEFDEHDLTFEAEESMHVETAEVIEPEMPQPAIYQPAVHLPPFRRQDRAEQPRRSQDHDFAVTVSNSDYLPESHPSLDFPRSRGSHRAA